LVHDSRNFHAYRAAAHAPGLLVPVAGADHFTIVEQLRAPGSLLVGQIMALASMSTQC
jgi:arylformamidase